MFFLCLCELSLGALASLQSKDIHIILIVILNWQWEWTTVCLSESALQENWISLYDSRDELHLNRNCEMNK